MKKKVIIIGGRTMGKSWARDMFFREVPKTQSKPNRVWVDEAKDIPDHVLDETPYKTVGPILSTHYGERICRECGCTDLDCSGCIDRTGEACHWVEENLCSACVEEAVIIDTDDSL